MKIKKKQYQKELGDKFWQGVQAGMRYALNNPKYAEKYVDDIMAKRRMVENAMPAVRRFDAIIKLFANANKI